MQGRSIRTAPSACPGRTDIGLWMTAKPGVADPRIGRMTPTTTNQRGRPLGDRVPGVLAPHAAVLRRGPDEVQVGVDPARALTFSGRGYAAFLRHLDVSGSPATARLVGRRAGLTDAQLDDALYALQHAGLLLGAGIHAPRLATIRLRLVGAGALARDLAGLLLASGVGHLLIDDPKTPERRLYPTAEVATRGEALRDVLAPAYPGRVSVVEGGEGAAPSVAATVLVGDGPEPDRLVVDSLMRRDQAHLIVRTSGTAATVGPLVLPGTTACLRCHDLGRRDRDPLWPNVLAQLVSLRLAAPPVIAAWAAAYASSTMLAWLSGGATELAGNTAELSEEDFIVRHRVWPAHPECGCRWSGQPEWAP